jgi:hypothetical protein
MDMRVDAIVQLGELADRYFWACDFGTDEEVDAIVSRIGLLCAEVKAMA